MGASTAGGGGTIEARSQRPGGGQAVPGVADVGEPAVGAGRQWVGSASRQACWKARCKLILVQVAELDAVLHEGPAACGYADQCWTLARIAEVVWQRFGQSKRWGAWMCCCTGSGERCRSPARPGCLAGRGGDRRVREETWPVAKDSGGLGRLAGLRGRVLPGPEAAEGPHPGPPRLHPGGAGDRRQQPKDVAGCADRGQARLPTPRTSS